jgi:hypothetical protein
VRSPLTTRKIAVVTARMKMASVLISFAGVETGRNMFGGAIRELASPIPQSRDRLDRLRDDRAEEEQRTPHVCRESPGKKLAVQYRRRIR